MASHLLILYEIAYKASQVTTKKAYKEFERWVKVVLEKYHDAAVNQCAKIHLIRLQQEFSV